VRQVTFSGVFGLAMALMAPAFAAELSNANWSPQAAARYLDQRASWWIAWPPAAREHETFCISCHTTLPYALGRRALRGSLAEKSPSPNEQKLYESVMKRVRHWNDVEPLYPDQLRGLPKTSESRGTEAITNALVLVWRDTPSGALSPEARLALKNMWALQMKSPDMKGAWAWLQFHNAPWEGDSQYYGTTLAAITIGTAPENYQTESEIQPGLKLLRDYLVAGMDSQTPLDRVVLLWASAKLQNLLTESQQKRIIDETLAKQREDGGFSMSTLVGSWKRKDNTPLDPASDGYATGLVAFALEQTRAPQTEPALKRAIAWLNSNQNAQEGKWAASSLNKQRDPATDAAKFMSDAATAYAVLALENAKK
jgi:squalene-hopene/tetraprenyl-beta-curcumene cyclase